MVGKSVDLFAALVLSQGHSDLYVLLAMEVLGSDLHSI